MGNWGSIIGGVGTAAAGGASIASAIQGKSAAEEAAKLQRQALGQTAALGGQSTALGLAQLDLQRQVTDRQIDLANQILSETQPFRDRAAGASTPVPTLAPINVGGAVSLPTRTFSPTPFTATPAERDTLEAQFRNAREATISQSPVRGGALASQLLDLQMGRAGAVVGLESDLTRRNQALTNAAEATNFQALLENDRFNAADSINVRNINAADAQAVRNANAANTLQTSLFDRDLAARIGFQAPGVALPALASAGAAFNPAAGAAIFNPAMAAQSSAAATFGQNFASANQQSAGSGQALGSLAAAGKLANMKNGGKSTSGSTGFGK